MIINPHFFTYRLIISSLIITLVAVSVFGVSNYLSLKTQQKFLEQEKRLMENELSEMIERYDDLKANNELMSAKLKDSKIIPHNNNLEPVFASNNDESVLAKLKQEISILRTQNKKLSSMVDSLIQVNNDLKKELESVSKEKSKYNSVYLENEKIEPILKNITLLK